MQKRRLDPESIFEFANQKGENIRGLTSMAKTRIWLSMFIATAFFCLPCLSSGDEEAVQARGFLSRDKIHPGEIFKIAVVLTINGGWHINANPVNDEFLIPTTLTAEENNGFRVLQTSYPQPKTGKFEYSEVELQIYSTDAVLGLAVKADESMALGGHKLKLKVSYQACNDRFCLPPKEIGLEIPVEVVPGSEASKEINQDIFAKIQFPKEIN